MIHEKRFCAFKIEIKKDLVFLNLVFCFDSLSWQLKNLKKNAEDENYFDSNFLRFNQFHKKNQTKLYLIRFALGLVDNCMSLGTFKQFNFFLISRNITRHKHFLFSSFIFRSENLGIIGNELAILYVY